MGNTTVTILLLFLLGFQANSFDADLHERINSFMEDVLGCRQIVGMNLAVVRGKETLMQEGYGVTDLQSKARVDGRTLFGIASLTKAFTTTLLGQMIAEYGLNWDLPVREILGEDFFFYDGLRSNQTTLRDLAAHRLGIPGHNNMRMQDGLTRNLLAKKMRFLRPTRGFRTTFMYSNLMYGLLTHISEIVGGDSWEEQILNKLFSPLGMNTSTFMHETDLQRPDLAHPYLPYRGKLRKVDMEFHRLWGKLGGSGSILSNAEDMARWLHLQLNKGKNQRGEQVIWNEVLDDTHTPQNQIKQSKTATIYQKPVIPVTYDHSQYGLGWRTGYYRGNRMLLHTGTSWGYGALLTLLPDVGIGIYSSVTGPDDGYLGRRLSHMYIMDLLLGEKPWLNHTTACSFPAPWNNNTRGEPNEIQAPRETQAPSNTQAPSELQTLSKTQAPSEPQLLGQPQLAVLHFTPHQSAPPCKPLHHLDAQKYVGSYGNFAYGNVTFSYNETSGRLQLRYGELGYWDLDCQGKDNFTGKGRGLMWVRDINNIVFQSLDPEGNDLYKVTIYLESRDPPVFIKGLKMADAPAPPDPAACGSSPGGSNQYFLLSAASRVAEWAATIGASLVTMVTNHWMS